MNECDPWPFPQKHPEDLRENGFSDDELAHALKLHAPDLPRSPGMFWTSEVYSFGKCIRRWLGWPERLPLPAYNDHGVTFAGLLARHEREARAKVHLLWGADRAKACKALLPTKTIVRIPHPWITYRHAIKPLQAPDRRGTLAFYPHTTDAVRYSATYHAGYLDQLKQLEDRFKPVVVMLHMHDVRPELVKLVRGAGFPVVSAGHASSDRFVDRFYDLVDHFAHATSPTGGSELFYCHEFGLHYFIHGDPPRYVNHGDPNLPLGERRPLDIYEQKNVLLRQKFFGPQAQLVAEGKDDFVIQLLGLDAQPDRAALRRLLVLETLRLWNHDGEGAARAKSLVKALLRQVV